MTEPPTKPNSLEAILAAAPDSLSKWSEGVELPDPKQLTHESRLAEAWLSQPHEFPASDTTQTEQKAWTAWFSARWLLAFAVPATAIAFFFLQPKQATTVPATKLQSKGNTPSTPALSHGVTLQLGTLAPKRQTLQRVQHGDTLLASQSIFFGFTLKQPGYLYLWSKTPKSKLMFLIPSINRPSKRLPIGPFELTSPTTQKALSYPLKQHRGPLSFGTFITKTPLTTNQIQQLRDTRRPTQQIKQWLRKVILSFDQVTIQIKKD